MSFIIDLANHLMSTPPNIIVKNAAIIVFTTNVFTIIE